MTKPIRRMILILALMAAFVLCACDDSVNHWNREDGSPCYSTLQRGCLDALMGWEEE